MQNGHYHLNAKVFSRRKGHSAVAAAAYRCGGQLKDERTGDVHDYRRRGGVVHSEVLLPDEAPEWASDREKLWNAIEGLEKRRDAQVAREMDIGLPHQLSPDERRELIRSFIKEQFTSRGMVADLAIHEPQKDKGDDPRNHHAHVMLTLRQATPHGFRTTKTREWNSKELLEDWRAKWAEYANQALERAGHEVRLDHRSYKDRGLDQQPEIHLGKRRAGMVKRGVQPMPPSREYTRDEREFLYRYERASPPQRRIMNRPQSRWAQTRRSINYKRLELGDRVYANYRILQKLRRGQTHRADFLQGKLNAQRGDRQEARRQHRQAFRGVEQIFQAAYKEPGLAMQRFKILAHDQGLERALKIVKASPSRLGARKGIRIFTAKEKSRAEGDRLLKFLDHRVIEFETAARRLAPIEEMFQRTKRQIDRERASKAHADTRERQFMMRWVNRDPEMRHRYFEGIKRAKRQQEEEARAMQRQRETDERVWALEQQGRYHEAQAVRENHAMYERSRRQARLYEAERDQDKTIMRERARQNVVHARQLDKSKRE